jgi:hypothetical protein
MFLVLVFFVCGSTFNKYRLAVDNLIKMQYLGPTVEKIANELGANCISNAGSFIACITNGLDRKEIDSIVKNKWKIVRVAKSLVHSSNTIDKSPLFEKLEQDQLRILESVGPKTLTTCPILLKRNNEIKIGNIKVDFAPRGETAIASMLLFIPRFAGFCVSIVCMGMLYVVGGSVALVLGLLGMLIYGALYLVTLGRIAR